MKYVYLKDNTAAACIEGPDGFDPVACYPWPQEGGEWVECPIGVEPGDTFDGTNWIPAPRPAMPLTKLQFLRRFTAEERIAIRASADPIIVDFMALLDLAEEVRVDDPDTVAALTYLTSVGLLDTGRQAEILA